MGLVLRASSADFRPSRPYAAVVALQCGLGTRAGEEIVDTAQTPAVGVED